jgi:hypothetical protein
MKNNVKYVLMVIPLKAQHEDDSIEMTRNM